VGQRDRAARDRMFPARPEGATQAIQGMAGPELLRRRLLASVLQAMVVRVTAFPEVALPEVALPEVAVQGMELLETVLRGRILLVRRSHQELLLREATRSLAATAGAVPVCRAVPAELPQGCPEEHHPASQGTPEQPVPPQ